MGDCRTFAFLGRVVLLLRTFLERSPGFVGAGGDSISMSTGEFVAWVERLPSNEASGSFCACNAGDVKGLKYAPGTVYWLSTGKCESRGVTAGDTRGVNDICRID